MQEETIRFIRGLVRCETLSRGLIEEALTAAWATGTSREGNRQLARMGLATIKFVIAKVGDFMNATRGNIPSLSPFIHAYTEKIIQTNGNVQSLVRNTERTLQERLDLTNI